MRSRTTLLLLIALVSPALFGCRAQGVVLATEPPGASVLIDREASGFVTPCVLDLSEGGQTRVDFELPGYTTATRVLVNQTRTDLVFWSEATVNYNTWNFPLWVNAEDFLRPVKFRGGKAPGRVFVRLAREADADRP